MTDAPGFDWSGWLAVDWEEAAMVLLGLVVLYVAIIAFTRLMGLRSFAKMSAFDFATTVAIGSLFASAIANENPSLGVALVAFAGLYGVQRFASWLRLHIPGAESVIDNTPLLLMDGPEILHENLMRASVTEDDLRAKLREANVLHYDQVRAVVLETTGDISVLHSDDPDTPFDPGLLKSVRGAERISG